MLVEDVLTHSTEYVLCYLNTHNKKRTTKICQIITPFEAYTCKCLVQAKNLHGKQQLTRTLGDNGLSIDCKTGKLKGKDSVQVSTKCLT